MTGLESLISFLNEVVTGLSSQLALQIGAWLLVWVFAWSGTAKLRDPATAAQALVDFRATRRPVRALGVALGVVELGIALGIASSLARPLFLALAAAVFCLFAVSIASSLLRGERFPCRCFGNSDAPLSKWTAGRTGALAAVALLLTLGSAGASNALEPGTVVLQAVAALGLLGTIVVTSSLPVLLRWNSEPLPIWPRSDEEE